MKKDSQICSISGSPLPSDNSWGAVAGAVIRSPVCRGILASAFVAAAFCSCSSLPDGMTAMDKVNAIGDFFSRSAIAGLFFEGGRNFLINIALLEDVCGLESTGDLYLQKNNNGHLEKKIKKWDGAAGKIQRHTAKLGVIFMLYPSLYAARCCLQGDPLIGGFLFAIGSLPVLVPLLSGARAWNMVQNGTCSVRTGQKPIENHL